MTNVCFAEAIKLGHDNGDCLGNQWFSCPYQWNLFWFSKDMDDKVKNGLVLSVIWC